MEPELTEMCDKHLQAVADMQADIAACIAVLEQLERLNQHMLRVAARVALPASSGISANTCS